MRTDLLSTQHLSTGRGHRRLAAALSLALLAPLAIGLAACAKQQRPPSVLSPWREEQRRYFDDGIDFETGRVSRLRGRWSQSEEELFQNRIGHADVVALGRIRLVSSEARGDQVRGYRIAFAVHDLLKGDLGGFPDERLITLSLPPDSEGFRLLQVRGKEIVGAKVVLYLKWRKAGDKEREFHWHLSDANARPATELRAMLARLRAR